MLPSIFNEEPRMTSLFDSIFNDQVMPNFYRSAAGGCSNVNILDNEKDITIELTAPGFKKEHVNIDLNNDVLTVSAKIEEKDTEEKKNYIRREFCSREFSRSFSIPNYLDQEKVTASQDNGIISIVIPKKEQAIKKGPRQIKIR
ncbi:MAG: Hsp20/alpha crystallin family protein [Bacteroidales bacterium]|jgi:HSP20 family protein|nr:Hsp20/alpha crystallin family protein [Bacteroidales bacterium]